MECLRIQPDAGFQFKVFVSADTFKDRLKHPFRHIPCGFFAWLKGRDGRAFAACGAVIAGLDNREVFGQSLVLRV
jgi:hypothetical protein